MTNGHSGGQPKYPQTRLPLLKRNINSDKKGLTSKRSLEKMPLPSNSPL